MAQLDRGSKKEFRQLDRWWHWVPQVFKPLPSLEDLEENRVATAELRMALDNAADSEKATELIREHAESVLKSREERARAAEGRATTLLGTVPIAASLLVAGAGLILDAGKVGADARKVFMVVIAVLLALLLMCAFIASRAVLKVRIEVQTEPVIHPALAWAKNAEAKDVALQQLEGLAARADETLYMAEYRRAQLRVAYYWYRAALSCFGLLGIMLAVYVFYRS